MTVYAFVCAFDPHAPLEQWPMAKQKKDDPEIEYQYRPNGTDRCGNCSMFRAPSSCTAVAGVIVRQGWCKIFEPRGKT